MKPKLATSKIVKGGMTIHAEQDAIKKLKPHSQRKPKKVSLIVGKFSKTSKTASDSMPCIKCMCAMANYLPKKGYVLEYIYYTGVDKDIHCTTLKKLVIQEKFHMSMYLAKSVLNKKKSVHDLKMVKKLKAKYDKS